MHALISILTPAAWLLLFITHHAVIAAPTNGSASAESPPAAEAASDDPLDFFRHLQLGVTLEGYYEYNANEPHDRINRLRAYDTRANTFGIQQVALIVESAPDVDAGRRFGARVDLQFGQAAAATQGNPINEPRVNVYRDLWQAFGTYVFPVGRGLQADFGKFASNLGFETNYAKENHQFSRGYLFTFLPGYHSGLRLSLPVHDRVTLMYMLTNGIQQTEDFNDFKSNHLVVIVTPVNHVTWTFNYYFGREQPDRGPLDERDGYFRVADTYIAYAPTPALSFGLDANYVTNEVDSSDSAVSLQGFGAYARYQVTTPVALAVRYERLDDEGLFGGIDQVLEEVTATAEYKFGDGFLVRGELRSDWSDEATFTPERREDDFRNHQNTLTLGMVWWFGNKRSAW